MIEPTLILYSMKGACEVYLQLVKCQCSWYADQPLVWWRIVGFLPYTLPSEASPDVFGSQSCWTFVCFCLSEGTRQKPFQLQLLLQLTDVGTNGSAEFSTRISCLQWQEISRDAIFTTLKIQHWSCWTNGVPHIEAITSEWFRGTSMYGYTLLAFGLFAQGGKVPLIACPSLSPSFGSGFTPTATKPRW